MSYIHGLSNNADGSTLYALGYYNLEIKNILPFDFGLVSKKNMPW